MFYHDTRLPWSENPEDQRRLRTIMTSVLVIMLLLSLAIPMIRIADHLVDQMQEVPARFSRLIVEEKPAPPPPPPLRQEEVRPQPEQRPEPVAREQPPRVEPRRQAEQQPAPGPTARERAARTGLLALSNDIAEMRDTTIAQGLESRTLQARAAAESRSEAPKIAERATRGSGGIDTSTLARNTGNTQLAGRETTRVAVAADGSSSAGAGAPAARGALPTRTTEEIQMVFDQNKGALNTLYNRALRTNPALAGKVVLRLTIAPGGEVTGCEIVSSEFRDPELERRLAARIQLFNFGAKDVAAITITYPIDFFPG